MKQQYNPLKSWLTIFLILVCIVPSRSQSVNHGWTKGVGGTEYSTAQSVTAEYPGYIYTVGYFTGTADFNPGVGVANLTAQGSFMNSAYVLKLDTAGNFIWAKHIDANISEANSVAVDSIGGVYVTGSFWGTADLDPGMAVYNVVSNGDADIFMLHLDSAGSFIWGKSIGGLEGFDVGYSIAIDSLGNVYVTGSYGDTVDFDPGPGVFNLTSHVGVAGEYDAFLLKLDFAGDFVWAKVFGGPGGVTSGQDLGQSLALDNQGNIFVAGYFMETADFDPGPGVSNITAGLRDAFIARFDTAGNFSWARKVGGADAEDYGQSVTVDNAGNVLVVGEFESTVDFDPGPGVVNHTSNGTTDVYVSKFDGSGNFIWVKTIGGADIEKAYTIKSDAFGNVYISGSFSTSAMDFDPGASVFDMYKNVFGPKSFVLKLSSSGNFQWARNFGGGSNAPSYRLNCYMSLSAGSIYLAGNFIDEILPVDFDPGPMAFNLPFSGIFMNTFIQKLGQSVCGTPTYSSLTINGCDSLSFNGVIYSASGNPTALLVTTGGCDSIVNLTTIINHSSSSLLSQTACDSFNFNGNMYTTSGLHLDTFVNAVGCDSVVSLGLTLLHSSFDTLIQSACDSFVLNGIAYYSTGFHNQVYTSVLVGCDSVIVLDLTINNVDVSINTSGSTLSANATGASYQWIDCDGFIPIPGETGQSLIVTQIGNYAVIVTQNGCSDTSSCIVVNGVDETAVAHQLSVYPNPSHGTVTIATRNLWHNARVKVIDVAGRQVQQRQGVTGRMILLDLSELTTGVYVIEIMDDEGTTRTRVAKH
jgi:hypothetical protein